MAPQFKNCPIRISADLPLGSNQTLVNWDVPIATDNSGEIPTVTSLERQLPLMLGPGLVAMRYVATDTAGNSDYCIFTITVSGEWPIFYY